MKKIELNSVVVNLPDKLFSTDHLSAAAIALYCFIAYNKSAHGTAPSKEEGMRALSIGRDTYAKHIAALSKAGLIKIIENRQNGKFTSPDIIFCQSEFYETDTDLPGTKKSDMVKSNTVLKDQIVCTQHVTHNTEKEFKYISKFNINKKSSSSSLLSPKICHVKTKKKRCIYELNQNTAQQAHTKQSISEQSIRIFQDLLDEYSVNSEKESTTNYNLTLIFRKVYMELSQNDEQLSITRNGLIYAMEKFKQVRNERKIYAADRYLKTFFPSALMEYNIFEEKKEDPYLKNKQFNPVTTGEISRFYEDLRRNNRSIFEKRKKEIFTRVPELEKNYKLMLSAMSTQNFASLEQNKQKLTMAKEKIRLLENEQQLLLLQYGYEKNALEMIETCPHCHDTGFLNDGDFCSCREKAKEMIMEQKEKKQEIRQINQEGEMKRLQSIA